MSTVKKGELALEKHQSVVEETKSMLYRWLCVLSVNSLTHFMRMGVSLAYMTGRLGASELSASAVVTLHLAIIGLANAYLSFSMDTHSFETMITARFGLLVLATLAEWLAQDFLQFAVAYSVASLAIVWITVPDAYFIQMLPAKQAKELQIQASMLNQTSIGVGLSLGGCIGGLFSLNSVFYGSFVIAAVSLLFMMTSVIGKEERIKQYQSEEISQIYVDYPDLFPDNNDHFPMPFAKKSTLSCVHSNNEGSPSNLSSPSLSSSLFCSLRSIPLAYFLLSSGLRTAQSLELLGWWNVYATQVMSQSIALSNLQMVLSITIGTLTMALVAQCAHAHLLSLNTLLDRTLLVHEVSGLSTTALFVFIFPNLDFNEFWFGYPCLYICTRITDPFLLPFQVFESPADEAGKVFALNVLSRSMIPAVQHVIIGALWNQGGPKHPWFFRWFAILNGSSLIMFICYWISKKWVMRGEHSEWEYRVIE